MITATVKEIKTELSARTQKNLVELCLALARFKKENKELITYLLYESENEAAYITGVQKEIDELFENINHQSFYLVKKSIRKILRLVKKYIRYSKQSDTEIALLMHFCRKMKVAVPDFQNSVALYKLYTRQLELLTNSVRSLHDDLQYDYTEPLKNLALKPPRKI